jgi:hypothetical protein
MHILASADQPCHAGRHGQPDRRAAVRRIGIGSRAAGAHRAGPGLLLSRHTPALLLVDHEE